MRLLLPTQLPMLPQSWVHPVGDTTFEITPEVVIPAANKPAAPVSTLVADEPTASAVPAADAPAADTTRSRPPRWSQKQRPCSISPPLRVCGSTGGRRVRSEVVDGLVGENRRRHEGRRGGLRKVLEAQGRRLDGGDWLVKSIFYY